MSAVPVDSTAQEPFSRKTLFWGIFASLFAAAGFFLLSTYAPDFRLSGEGATPMSKGGSGYAGLAEWLRLNGETPLMARTERDLETDMLLIVTISPDSDPQALEHILKVRKNLDTLFVLPKWQTYSQPDHEGWEIKFGRLPSSVVNDWLGKIANAKIGVGEIMAKQLDIAGQTVGIPDQLQWVTDDAPLVAAGDGKAVLTEIKDRPIYILTDPDLINNAGLRDPDKAAAVLRLIEFLQPDEGPVMFDLTLHGAGRKYDLAKLLVEPPSWR